MKFAGMEKLRFEPLKNRKKCSCPRIRTCGWAKTAAAQQCSDLAVGQQWEAALQTQT